MFVNKSEYQGREIQIGVLPNLYSSKDQMVIQLFELLLKGKQQPDAGMFPKPHVVICYVDEVPVGWKHTDTIGIINAVWELKDTAIKIIDKEKKEMEKDRDLLEKLLGHGEDWQSIPLSQWSVFKTWRKKTV